MCVCVSVNLSFDKDKTNNIYLYMEDSTGIKISFFRTQLFLNVFTHCGFGITSRDECWKRKKEMISELMTLTHSQLNKTNAALHI